MTPERVRELFNYDADTGVLEAYIRAKRAHHEGCTL